MGGASLHRRYCNSYSVCHVTRCTKNRCCVMLPRKHENKHKGERSCSKICSLLVLKSLESTEDFQWQNLFVHKKFSSTKSFLYVACHPLCICVSVKGVWIARADYIPAPPYPPPRICCYHGFVDCFSPQSLSFSLSAYYLSSHCNSSSGAFGIFKNALKWKKKNVISKSFLVACYATQHPTLTLSVYPSVCRSVGRSALLYFF